MVEYARLYEWYCNILLPRSKKVQSLNFGKNLNIAAIVG